MTENTYCVPSLSLSSSRSKKYIPTKDTSKQKTSLSQQYRNQSSQFQQNISSAVYTQHNSQQILSKPNNALNIPKSRPYQYRPPIFSKNQVKEINRNVYLSNEQEPNPNSRGHIHLINQKPSLIINDSNNDERLSYFAVNNVRQNTLQRNPQAPNQFKRPGNNHSSSLQFNKIDVNKVLFERKISKLIEQAKFYDDQLDSFYSQICKTQIEELEQIAKKNMQGHESILNDLLALTI